MNSSSSQQTAEQSGAFSRRQFHRAALASLAGASSIVGGRLFADEGAAGDEASKQTAKGFIDVHVHIGPLLPPRVGLSVETLLRWMDARHVSQACVLSLISPESFPYPATPYYVLEQTKAHRDRLIPFCSIDPRTDVPGGIKGWVGMLRRYIDLGAKGFGEHKTGIAIDDPRNLKMFEACAEVGLPLLFHLDNERNMDAPGLPGLEKALQTVPELTMIGHGPGWWGSICGAAQQRDLGGYPRGKVAPGGAIDRMMEKYPNLYGDLSAGSGANALRRDMEFGREFVVRRADRLLFGTDNLAIDQVVPQFELLDEMKLPIEVADKVFRENARKLLKL
jgi:hypothetical protein